jgi:hypothetical protein
MVTFRIGQAVIVNEVGAFPPVVIPPTEGIVRRKRMQDDGAWVALVHRIDGVCPFPADDESGRGAHVLAYPENCEPCEAKT